MTGLITDYVGALGLWTMLFFMGVVAGVLHLKWTPEKGIAWLKSVFQRGDKAPEESPLASAPSNDPASSEEERTTVEMNDAAVPLSLSKITKEKATTQDSEQALEITPPREEAQEASKENAAPVAMEVTKTQEEDTVDQLSKELVEKYGAFDPTLELSGFQFPTLELLKDYGSGSITIDEDELEVNKNKIIDTLRNYKIEIAKIKANIGPTVTLYEIVPAAGIRISKSKTWKMTLPCRFRPWGFGSLRPFPAKAP